MFWKIKRILYYYEILQTDVKLKINLKMNIGILFLKSNLTGIITFSELDWITTNQSNFTRLEESIAIKLGRMLDAWSINIGCHLNT